MHSSFNGKVQKYNLTKSKISVQIQNGNGSGEAGTHEGEQEQRWNEIHGFYERLKTNVEKLLQGKLRMTTESA
jgi:hypothetical protein